MVIPNLISPNFTALASRVLVQLDFARCRLGGYPIFDKSFVQRVNLDRLWFLCRKAARFMFLLYVVQLWLQARPYCELGELLDTRGRALLGFIR
jgi:hypothetical protein